MPGDLERPIPRHPSQDWEHYPVYQQIRNILPNLPIHFTSAISITGVRATEIYAFGSVLGLTIEQEVIRTLNELREIWDANGEYSDFRFIRQSQTFPDVLLANKGLDKVIFGIELKSWYLLAKEKEPSFRYQVSPNACATADLLVIIPWALSNVLSGTPVIFQPYLESARYVAELRNYWWQHERSAQSSAEIKSPSNARPYPKGRDKIVDHPVSDGGNNFGRIARTRILDDYVKTLRKIKLLDIEVDKWLKFLKSANTPDSE